MNWGYKILFVYIAFVIVIMWMVFKSSTQKVDLVSQDYYAKELKYQEIIDETKRAGTLSAPLKCEIANHELSVIFPREFAGKKINGEIFLYCPSNEDRDIKKPFSTQDSIVRIAIPSINTGLHEIQISWNSDSLKYYFTKKISL